MGRILVGLHHVHDIRVRISSGGRVGVKLYNKKAVGKRLGRKYSIMICEQNLTIADSTEE